MGTHFVSGRKFIKTAAGLSFSVYAGGLITGCGDTDSPSTNFAPELADFVRNI